MVRRLFDSIILLLPMVFMAIGCSDDLRNQDIVGADVDEVSISFSVDKVAVTRSGSSLDWESAIDHAYLLFYDSSNEEGNDFPVTAVRAEIKENSSDMLTFKMPLILGENKDYKLVAVANADDYAPEGFSSFGGYLSTWLENDSEVESRPLHMHKDGIITADLDLLPMVGSPENDGKFSFTKHNGTYQVSTSLRFRRSVARVDVVNIVREGFIVEGVAICNWRDAVAVEDSDAEVGVILSEISEFLETPEPDESGIQKMIGQLYCFPSVSEDATLNDNLTTALIIKAKYDDDESPSYYRVNVGMSGSRAEIKANTKYTVTIQSVKGSGAATPEEAYASDDNLLVLSMVEDWDLEGNFAMDDYGNFIILSRGSLEFAADSHENVEIKVLRSKEINWKVEYLSDGENSAEAFKVTKISDSSIIISPAGTNSGTEVLSGKCRVSAVTSQGNTLTVDVSLRQFASGDSPVIPWEKDFALVPLQGDRVKVDHEAMTIEIDGFDPDCFNSFIDIPFQVYISERIGKDQKIEANVITSDNNALQWPLEGRVARQPSKNFCYCKESFTDGSVYNSANPDKKVDKATLDIHDLELSDGDKFYISVGAMAPDDPDITRTISVKLYGGGEVKDDWTYTLKIKPRPIIIDDVIISDEDGQSYVVMDRNVQLISGSNGFPEAYGRDNDGKRMQAYHYCGWNSMKIPFKLDEGTENIIRDIKENYHTAFQGETRELNTFSFMFDGIKTQWLNTFVFKEGMPQNSPFYDANTIGKWTYPNANILETCRTNMKVSKMRMFLMSEVPAIGDDGVSIPICCYFTFAGDNLGATDINTPGYLSVESTQPEWSGKYGVIFNADSQNVRTFSNSADKQIVVIRLVYSLTQTDVEEYKTGFLGYGASPLTLSPCHPDTYPWPSFTPVK